MRTSIFLGVALVAVAFAGCASPDAGPTPTPTPTATPTPTPTGTPTVVPSVTPPTLPTVQLPTPVTNVTDPLTPNVTDVLVVAAPDRVAAGETAPICFRVLGTGTVPHVAVHWDTESHPNATAFAEYDGGAVYPDNATAARPVTLPGTFCAYLPTTNATLYYRAHALASATDQKLSVEKALEVGDATGIAFAGDNPEVASPDTNATICWEIAGGAGNYTHTAIHWDNASHPGSTSFADYAGGAVYSGNATVAAVDDPGPHCGTLRVPASGVVYYRAHLLHDGTNALTLERSLVVAPAIGIVSMPASAAAGSKATVCWRVEGNGTIPHTAIHFDDESHPSASSFADYDLGAAYPGNATSPQPVSLPGSFCTGVTMPASGTLYLRAHALDPSTGRNELSAEAAIRVQ